MNGRIGLGLIVRAISNEKKVPLDYTLCLSSMNTILPCNGINFFSRYTPEIEVIIMTDKEIGTSKKIDIKHLPMSWSLTIIVSL